MTVRVRLLAPGGEKELHTEPGQFLSEDEILVTITESQRHGVFKAVTSTTQTTTIITAPDAGGAIILTDLIVTTNKGANGILTLHFTDDVETINIVIFPVDIAVNMPINIVGLFRGWRNARLELVTTVANFDATVTAGYMKVPAGLPFGEWDALR